jgi:poly(3-hydroxybutyrate) depolymerase
VVLAALALLFALVVLAPAALVAPAPPAWVPTPLEKWGYDVRLALATSGKDLSSLRAGSLSDRRVWRGGEGETIRLESDGLTLVGSLHLPPGFRPPASGAAKPAVLLLHGSTPRGRRLGIYRVLAPALAECGFVVLNLDQRGYGDSEDPPRLDDPAAFDYVADVGSAVRYLTALPGVDPDRVYVVGHSFGGDVALAAGTRIEGIAGIAAIGPARRFAETVGRPDAPQLDYFRRREMRYMRLPAEPEADVFLRYRGALTIDMLHAYYGQPGHAPVLLIDGALEGADNLAFLAREHEAMAPPKAYVTLPDADHYLNVSDFGPIVLYDARVLAWAVDLLAGWLAQQSVQAAGTRVRLSRSAYTIPPSSASTSKSRYASHAKATAAPTEIP